MRQSITAALGILTSTILATASFAADAPMPKSGAYTVEPGHTQVIFSLLHMGFTPYTGIFSKVTGTLKLDASHPAKSQLDVTVPVSSLQTTSDVLTGELAQADWFNAAKYPTAHFVSTSVTPTGHDDATIVGNFTLHGVTKPVTLHAHFVGSGTNPLDKHYTVGFEATGMLKRSDFGVSKYVPLVGDDVTLTIAGAFEKTN